MESTEKQSPELLQRSLAGFIGTTDYHSHMIGDLQLNLTDGCDFLRDQAECYWLFDAILSNQYRIRKRDRRFQLWKLEKQIDIYRTLTCKNGKKETIIARLIEYTDFPLDEITIWVIDGVAMLPCEY